MEDPVLAVRRAPTLPTPQEAGKHHDQGRGQGLGPVWPHCRHLKSMWGLHRLVRAPGSLGAMGAAEGWGSGLQGQDGRGGPYQGGGDPRVEA